LPHNNEAERSILGAILLENKRLNVVIEVLKPEDFFHNYHRHIYRQMIALGATQQAIDLVTLAEQLDRSDELESSGGYAYIAQLMDGVPHCTNVEHYARIVKQKALRRNLIFAADAIQQRAFEAEEDADAILAHAAETISGIAATVAPKSGVQLYTAPELMASAGQQLEYVAYPLAPRGMVALLDGAAKSAGKTTFIFTAVGALFRGESFLGHATKRVPVLLVTEESPRTLCLSLKRAGLTEMAELHVLSASFTRLSWPLLARAIEYECEKLGIGWLIIDTFYAVAGLGGEEENKAGAVDQAIAPVRHIAGRLDIPVTLSRHTRKSGGRVGESGRGSSALTGAADTVIELKRFPGNFSLTKRQLEITGRIEQTSQTIELQGNKYVVAPDAGATGKNLADQNKRLIQLFLADPKISIRQIAELTGIGRNRIAGLAAKLGWDRGPSGWKHAGAT